MTYSSTTTNGVASFDLAQELTNLQTLLLSSAAIPLSPYALVNHTQLLQQIIWIQSSLPRNNNGSQSQSPPDLDPATLLAHIQQTYEASATALAQGYATQLADQAAQTSHYQEQVMFLRSLLDQVVQAPLIMPHQTSSSQE